MATFSVRLLDASNTHEVNEAVVKDRSVIMQTGNRDPAAVGEYTFYAKEPTPLSNPPANPCGAKLNSSAASSILAAITSCAVHQPTVTTGCVPLTTSDGFGRGEQFSFGGMVFLIATSVWLMYFV